MSNKKHKYGTKGENEPFTVPFCVFLKCSERFTGRFAPRR